MYIMENERSSLSTNNITTARCGMDCTECRFAVENDCPGCPYSQSPSERKMLFEDEECEVGICCCEKGYDHCGKCPDFPCDTLKAVSLDTETGDGGARRMRLKEIRDREYRIKRSRISFPLTGFCLGISLGIIIGCITGDVVLMTAAGIISGTGLGVMISVFKGDKRK